MRVRTERHGRVRRALAAVAATLLPLAVLAAPEAAANGLVVEAEDAAATNYTPGVVNDARMSGGRFLQLWTATAPSTGDYRASYEVTAPTGGLYQLEVASTPPSGVTWASPYDLKVNDGAFEPVTQAVKGATITSEIARYRLGTVNLTAGANTLTFRVDDRRALDTRYVMYVDALTLTPTDLKVQTITADGAPLNVIEDGDPATFTVALNGAAPQPTQLSYVVRDYWSATVAQGTLPVAAGAESVVIDAGTLDIGHYSISAQVTGTAAVTTQASVVLAGADRTKPADSPFALDVAGGLLLPPDKWDAFARAMDLSGVTWIRERVSWGAVNPAAGQFDFTKDVRADGWTRALEGTGIKILEMMGGAPAWTRDSDKKLPNDLNAVHDFAKESAAYFAGRGVAAWEFLNEVNAGSWTTPTETADQYAAVLKAAAIGYEDSGADPLVSAAGMAGAQPYPWLELMLRNEVLDYADIYNYHLHQTYDPAVAPTPLPTGVPAYLGLLEEYDPGDTLGWLTEAGLRFPGTTGRPMTAEEQRALARYQTIWAVTSISQGTDKHFAFVAPPYDEGTGSWGLFEPTSFTPYAGYTAEAAMTAALGEGRYIGRVPGLPAGVTGHVFGDGDDSVLVLWAATPDSVTLDLDQSTGTLTNIVGASSAVSASAAGFTVDVGPDPIYLRVAGDVPADTSDAPEPPPTPQPTTFDTADRLVLMQTYPDAVSGNAREGGYALPIDAPTTVTLDVYNFNDAAVTGSVAGTGADGWTVAGGPQPVTVPAGGKATLTFQVSATSAVEFNKLSPVSFRGEFGGDPTSVSTTLVTTDQDVVTARHAFTDDGDAVRVAVKNTTGADLHLLNTRWTVGSRRGVAQTGATIPAGETREVEVPLPQLEPGSHTYELRLPFRGGTTLVYHGRIAVIDPAAISDAGRLPITVDGTLDDLSGVPTIDIVEDGKVVMGAYGGAPDLSGTVAVTWDEENLYLSARITDDVFSQAFTGADTWQGDGIQFSLAPGLPSESRTWDEYDFALTTAGAQLYRRRGTGVPIGVVTAADAAAGRDEATKTTVYELALPWTEIPSIEPSDGLMSFSLLVNDNDGAGRKGYIEWGSGIGTGKNPSLFKPLRLVN